MKSDKLDILDRRLDWQTRMTAIVDMMREMSRQTDPQAMVRAYGARMRQILPSDVRLSLSRRNLPAPQYCITRSSLWPDDVNPWKDKSRLPVLEGGLLGELIYGNEPRLIDELEIARDDPAAEYFAGQRSLLAIPLFDQGMALNMVVLLRREPAAFHPHQFPELVWLSNLFGRATHNLVLSEELQRAYDAMDQELKVVANIQRSLLPVALPRIPTMDLAVSYQTSQRAGGDYYDFFPLPEDKWGILIADVSGHGTPAAVLMAITHSIAHVFPGPPTPPGQMLSHISHHLVTRYTGQGGTFVTAFYGIYDPSTRDLVYACAGHNPPRVKRCDDGALLSLDGAQSLPLGIADPIKYQESIQHLQPHDHLVFYTDGITEAANAAGEMFGTERLDGILALCPNNATALLRSVLDAVSQFTAGHVAADDRTLLVATIA
jgi:sigma-B regulation protein RsbU (phosphoserine phosphatase)